MGGGMYVRFWREVEVRFFGRLRYWKVVMYMWEMKKLYISLGYMRV